MSDEIELRVAWREVSDRAAARDGAARHADSVLDDLLGRHRQQHRRYHGVRHVVWVIRHVRELATDVTAVAGDDAVDLDIDLPVAIAAAFFHDAIYDPRRDDNELRSAELATEQLGAIGWSGDDRAAVADCIRATADHLSEPPTARHSAPNTGRSQGPNVASTTAVVVDADLAVLGADPSAYQAYATGVRAEYGFLDDDAWRRGRSEVLRALLGRRSLYLTAPAHRRWESPARANLAAELAALR